jgi:hypothetical protein
MTSLTADEANDRNVEKMGEALGTQYSALWQEVAWLHRKWSEYVELFGTKPERIDLLNSAAPSFFRMVQDKFWEDILLHLARLTDSTQSVGKANLTLLNLPDLVADPKTSAALRTSVEIAKDKTRFCRDWRNRRIAHKDLHLAISGAAKPLESASRASAREALRAVADVLNVIDAAYMDSETHFDVANSIGGAMSLLHVLDDGVRTQEQRRERLSRGEWSKEDYPSTV